jgi:triacylglycerol lipase
MTGRRAVVGLSLLCALLLSAFAAQSASATSGTTVFECSSAAAKTDFSDAHCDSGAEKGSFGHIEVEPEREVEIEITNAKTKSETKESTPSVLKGTIAGVAGEITCTTVSGTGKSTNKEISGVKQNEGTGLAIKHTGCTVNKPINCKVKEPIEVTGSSLTVESLGGGKNEMGIEYKPKEKTLAQITFEGGSCLLKEKTFPIEGTMIATGSRGSSEATTSSGGTLIFTNAMTKETLKFAGNAAEYSGTITVNLKEGSEGTPLTLTTAGADVEGECPTEPEWPEEDCANWEEPNPSEKELEEEFEPKEEWKEEKAEEKAGKEPVLFVHGIFGDASAFHTAIKAFEAAGYKPGWLRSITYEWWKSNATTAKTVEKAVEGLLKATGSKKVDIVVHSMGALSTRYYIKELGGAAKVEQWASLASPNTGSTVAKACSYVSCVEMRRGSTFLKTLNANTTPAGPEYATWRSGTNKFGLPCDWAIIPPTSAELGPKAKNKTAACLTHSEMHEDATVIKQVREFVEP